MKWTIGLLAAIALPVAALAQPVPAPPPITATPLLPPSAQYAPPPMTPQVAPPPSDQTQTQSPAAPPGTPPPASPPAPPQAMQLTWVPQAGATLQVLDKVNAQHTVLTIKVGQQAQIGSLNIQVQACDIHPPDQPQDSAAYLTITDSRTDASGFRGWMCWRMIRRSRCWSTRSTTCASSAARHDAAATAVTACCVAVGPGWHSAGHRADARFRGGAAGPSGHAVRACDDCWVTHWRWSPAGQSRLSMHCWVMQCLRSLANMAPRYVMHRGSRLNGHRCLCRRMPGSMKQRVWWRRILARCWSVRRAGLRCTIVLFPQCGRFPGPVEGAAARLRRIRIATRAHDLGGASAWHQQR